MKILLMFLLLVSFCFALEGCKTDIKATVIDPSGQWEHRNDVGRSAAAPYSFIRYEFKRDGSFHRETGNSVVPQDTLKIDGSWGVEVIEEPQPSLWDRLFKKKDQLDELSETAGIKLPDGTKSKRGWLVLRYALNDKNDIPAGATLLSDRFPAMDLKGTFEVQERLFIVVPEKNDSSSNLIVDKQSFHSIKP